MKTVELSIKLIEWDKISDSLVAISSVTFSSRVIKSLFIFPTAPASQLTATNAQGQEYECTFGQLGASARDDDSAVQIIRSIHVWDTPRHIYQSK